MVAPRSNDSLLLAVSVQAAQYGHYRIIVHCAELPNGPLKR